MALPSGGSVGSRNWPVHKAGQEGGGAGTKRSPSSTEGRRERTIAKESRSVSLKKASALGHNSDQASSRQSARQGG
jgi:hypothetical protein